MTALMKCRQTGCSAIGPQSPTAMPALSSPAAVQRSKPAKCRVPSMRVPARWRAPFQRSRNGLPHDVSARKSRCSSPTSNAFSAWTGCDCEARLERATSFTSQQPPRTSASCQAGPDADPDSASIAPGVIPRPNSSRRLAGSETDFFNSIGRELSGGFWRTRRWNSCPSSARNARGRCRPKAAPRYLAIHGPLTHLPRHVSLSCCRPGSGY